VIDPALYIEKTLPEQDRARVYRRVKLGAFLRVGAGLFTLALVYAGHLAGLTRMEHILGVLASVLFLGGLSFPILGILKKTSSRRAYEVISILNNLGEVVGYTGIIYFLGGTRAFFLCPFYFVLVSYLGVITPPRFLYITTGFTTIALSLMTYLEFTGFLPHMDPFFSPPLPGPAQAMVVLATSCFLLVITVITSFMGKELKVSRDRQQKQFLELQKKTEAVEQADRELRLAHQELEQRVIERTAELKQANEQLTSEIEERLQAEAQLAAAQSLLKAAIEQTPAGILIADAPGGKIRLANPAALGIRDDSLGPLMEIPAELHPNNWKVYHPDGRPFQSKDLPMALAVREAKTSRNVEAIIRRPEGEERWVLGNASPILDSSGKVIAGIAVFTDITDRKRAEDEQNKLAAQMQEVQKLESLGVLAGGIAHDFNNLLMAIMGNADLALLTLSPSSPARTNLEEITRASQRAAELCRQMLAYSGKGRFMVGRHDLSEVVREMTQMLEVSISKKASLRYYFSPDLLPVEADITQLRQVIMNLITNASEALEEQSGIISVSTGIMECDQTYLAESFLDDKLHEGTYVYLEVSDSGCGMDTETCRKIFDPFFTTKFTGRGLGLAAVLGIVRGHKGAIKVYSEPGQGSTIKILLPAVDWTPEDRQRAEETPTAPVKTGTILLVDDDPHVRKVGSHMLSRLGFRVLTAVDGFEAIEVFRAGKEEIDCILLDLTMPRMNGEEAFRELRRLKADVRVILSSGYNEQEVIQRFSGKGLSGFIQKPYTLAKLQETLNRILT
jgi:signal transduction histidine kinase